MIILTQTQADAVRGETTEGHALDPRALADGVAFVLSEAVLSDPSHLARREFLQTLPTRIVAMSEFSRDGE
jgi:hypothetical protein